MHACLPAATYPDYQVLYTRRPIFFPVVFAHKHIHREKTEWSCYCDVSPKSQTQGNRLNSSMETLGKKGEWGKKMLTSFSLACSEHVYDATNDGTT